MCVPCGLDQRNDMEFYRPWRRRNFPFLPITVRSPFAPRECDEGLSARFPPWAHGRIPNSRTYFRRAVSELLWAQRRSGPRQVMMVLLGVFAAWGSAARRTVGIYGAVAYHG